MPLDPEPVEVEIESVREIARIKSFTTTATLIDALNDSQWLRALDLIGKYEALDNKHTTIIGGLLGANVNPDAQRLKITNIMRKLLGLEEMTMVGTIIETSSTGFASAAVPITADW